MAPASASIRRARPLLGTFVEIGISGTQRVDRNLAFDAAFGAIAKVHGLMSFHERDSDVSKLNRQAFERAVEVDPWTFRVIQESLELHHRSDGAFDITVAPVLQDIGLLPPPHDRPSSLSVTLSMADTVELLPGHLIRFRHSDVRIDLGGIAKGFAVDCAVEAMKALDVPFGLVNAGGDIAVFGPWSEPVHIRDPRDPRQLICCVEMTDEALASTGLGFDPLRSADGGGSAVIDPRTQRPVDGIAGATVCAGSCMIADALTKIVMIKGDDASPLIEHYHAGALMVRATGEIQATSNWKGTASLAA
jgi:FAD:protein FMN transferase